MPETSQRLLRRRWVRRALPAGVVAVIIVAATVVTHANATASPVDTYRTSLVTTGSVQQRLNLTGSAQRVNQVSESFAVAGTVSSLSVTVGDTVRSGQTLATLDPAPLLGAVTAAKASLAKAKATLETDQSATATATSTPTTSTRTTSTRTASTATTSPRVASTSGRSGGGTQPSLAAAQKRVTTSQRAVTVDLQKASAALTQCAQFFPTGTTPPPTASPTPSPTSSLTSRPTSTRSSPTTTRSTPAGLTACVSALKSAPTQQNIQRDQQTLSRSQTELTQAFTLAITTAGNTSATTATTTPSGSTGQSSTGQSSGSQSSGSQSSTGQSSTGQSSGGQSPTGQSGESGAARVVSDEAAVTNAEAALTSAQADLASTTLKSSIAGTVGSVSIVKGTSSNGKTIVIVGAGAVEVTVNVPLASMAGVHVGQKADVTPQGATVAAKGSVTSISLLPTATGSGTGNGTATASASSPTYPVVVLVPAALPALASGSRADVSLLIGAATHALTVPNSALTPLANGQALALTVKNGVTTRALVKTGYVGTLTTQVTSGLTAGQQVVLADLSTALPTNTTSSRRFGVGAGGTGGFGGAGFGAGAVTGGAGFPPRG